jgi:hypothetical protein
MVKMKQVQEIKAAVFRNPAMHDPSLYEFTVGIKWQGPDKFGVRGDGKTVDEAVQAAVTEFYKWLNE